MNSASDPLASTQAGLPISLIATDRAALLTCSPRDEVCEVVRRYADFDHIPVTEDGRPESRVLGLLDAHKFRVSKSPEIVETVYVTLREQHLIGSDAPIIEFILDADERDCRLLVSGKSISGLVTLSDLQALPVRAALFALVTRLEILMTETIKKKFEGGDAWITRLSDDRQQKLRDRIEVAKAGDAYVDALLCTEFADKVTVIAKSMELPVGRDRFQRDLFAAQVLRNALAHANEYASTRPAALKVCKTVKRFTKWIEHFGEASDQPEAHQ
jgi:hypothetical protein